MADQRFRRRLNRFIWIALVAFGLSVGLLVATWL